MVFLPMSYYSWYMTYFAKTNHIEYDEWFDKNIDPMDLVYEKEKNLVIMYMRSFMKCQSII